MNNTDKRIATILAHYGLAANGNVWQVEGQVFIHHRALERIAAQAKITFDPPTVLRAERDEAALLVVGRMGDRAEWSIGEALVNVNYHVPEVAEQRRAQRDGCETRSGQAVELGGRVRQVGRIGRTATP